MIKKMVGLIKDFLRWRRADHDERCVATCAFKTIYVRGDGSKTGETATHIAEFWIDGNGRRWTDVITESPDEAKAHGTIAKAKSNWKHHAILRDDCTRVAKPGNLVALNGGLTKTENK